MAIKKVFLFLILSLITASIAVAQSENPWFKTKQDYYDHQMQATKGFEDWLKLDVTSENKTDVQLRQILEAYLVSWINGAPHIKLIIDGKLEREVMADRKFKYQKEMLLALMFSKTLHMIENEDAKSDDFETHMAGVRGMIQVYKTILEKSANKRGKVSKKAKNELLDKYLEKEKNGELEDFVKKRVS